jgi:hypothetical protein
MNLKKWHKVLIGILFFLFTILFITPRVARRYIVKNSNELIGRKIDIHKIRINYFSGALRINGLKLYEQDEKTAFISFNKLLLNLDYWPLFRNELLISEIRLIDFYSKIEQNGDSFNFSDLIEEKDSVNIESTDTISQDPMILSFNNITISNSQANYIDLLLDHTISLDDINLFIPGFTLNSGSTNLAVNFDFTQGGHLNSNLNFNQLDSTYTINLNLDSLNLDIIEPYIKNSMDVSEVKGYFTNNILLQGNLQHIMQIHMKGWNKIESFEIIDQQNRKVLSFDEFRINIDTLLLHQKEIRINEIALVNPFALFELVDSTNNWSAMIIPTDSVHKESIEIKEKPSEKKQEFVYSLAKLELQNGEILFRDKTLNEEFEALLHNFNIKSTDITRTSSNVIINIAAELNQTSQINSELKINPQNMDDMNIDFSLDKFAMKDIEPYLMHYFGYPVEEGLFNFSTSNDLKSTSFISKNKIYIRNFELGKADKKDAKYRLPIKLAIGILSDKDGIIDLNIPVENKDEQTNIGNVGKLILQTFGNLIVKAATSPVDFLANLYGVNPNKINKVKIGIFENTLEEDEMEKLDIIAKILEDKPKLNCEFQYNINRNKYFDSLATKLTLNEFRETKKSNQTNKNSQSSDSLFRSFVIKKLDIDEASNSDIHDLCIKYIGQETLLTRIDSTKKVHFDLIKDYILTHKSIEPNKIKVISETTDSLPSNYENAIFKVHFKTINN